MCVCKQVCTYVCVWICEQKHFKFRKFEITQTCGETETGKTEIGESSQFLPSPTFCHIYTGWRKKNACFSNNCNFVYFQYKKLCQHQNNL